MDWSQCQIVVYFAVQSGIGGAVLSVPVNTIPRRGFGGRMHKRQFNISLALGLNERYDQRVAIGIIKFARGRSDWRLFGNEWLFHPNPDHRPARTDGIIARITDREQLKRLKAYKAPIVDIAGSYEDDNLSRAVNDDRLTGVMAGRHLLAKGLRNFAFVGVGEVAWSANRLLGMRDAVREVEGDDEFPVMKVGTPRIEKERALSELIKWLRELPKPCGVVAANDLIGYRVSVAAAMAGLTIPDQLAVLGVDDEEVYCQLSQPSLTSVPCDCERIGSAAAELLCRILDGDAAPRRVVVPPLQAVSRESTNIIIGEDRLVRDIRRFIRSHVTQGINVADVAAAFPLSRRALEKRFHKSGGKTIHEEIIATRLDLARQLLAQGRSATEAGLGSGFSTIQHFHYIFKKYLHVTPMAYAESSGKGADKSGEA